MSSFSASVVGSLPRPAFVRDLINGELALSADDRSQAMDAAIRYAVALQEAAGLDVITDGEWRRKSYIGVIAELATGFELSVNPEDGRPWTVVTERVTSSGGGFIANEVRFLKSITTKKVKATLPSPALLGERLWDARRSSRAYPDRDGFVRDCIPILRREVELVQAAGADVIQVDDPHLCLFVDPEFRKTHADPEAALAFAVDMVNAVVDGIDGVTFAVHLCRRAGARVRGERSHAGGYGPIIGALNRLHVQHLTMEFTAPEAGDLSVLRRLRDDFEVGLGCVSVTPGQIDSPDIIVERVSLALEHLAPERITLNPDCGFAPGSGARVDLDEVYAKLCNEVAAARRLRLAQANTEPEPM